MQHTFTSSFGSNSFLGNGNTFFFSKSIILLLRVLLEIKILFSCSLKQSFARHKVCLFSMCSNPQIVDIDYPQRICWPIFVVEDFSGLFSDPSIFSLKV